MKSLWGHHTSGGQSDQQNPQEYPRSSKKANSYTYPTQYQGFPNRVIPREKMGLENQQSEISAEDPTEGLTLPL